MKKEKRSDPKAWVLNPTARVVLGYGVRTRNQPLRTGKVDSVTEAEAILSLLGLRARGATDAEIANHVRGLSAAMVKILAARGLLVRPIDVPRRAFFDAALGSAEFNLVPRSLRARRPLDESWVVSKGVMFQRGKELPALLARSKLDLLETPTPIAWVRHPGTGMVFPYRSSLAQVAALLGGAAAFDAETKRVFDYAQILVAKDWDARETRRFRKLLEEGRTKLAQDGYVVLRGLVPPLFLASMRRYYRMLAKEGYLELDTTQVIGKRETLHDDRVLRYLHGQMAPVLCAVTGEAIKPSYSLVSRYFEGAVLKKHVDRPQCLWNVSLAIDADPETDAETAWPIYLRARNRTAAVRLELGDALIYRGTDVPHWRKELGKGKSVTMGLLHFVAKTFRGPLV